MSLPEEVRRALDHKNHAKALDLLQSLLAHDPLNHEALELLLRLSVARGGAPVEQARQLLSRAIEIQPDSTALRILRGNLWLHLEQPQQALDDWRALTRLEPHNDKFLYERGLLHVQLKEDKDAIDCFNQVIERSPNSARVHNDRGLCHKRAGRLDAAAADFTAAAAIDPRFVKPLVNLGNVRLAQRNSTAALTLYERATALAPGLSTIYKNMAAAHKALLHLPQAVACIEKALSLEPNSASLMLELSELLLLQGAAPRALACTIRALAIDAENPLCWHRFSGVLQATTFTAYDAHIAGLICTLLEKRDIARPNDVSRAVLGLLKANSEVRACLKLGQEALSAEGFARLCRMATQQPLLLRAMECMPFADADFEQLFMRARAFILRQQDALDLTALAARTFLFALVLQCDTNEHVYFVDDQEAAMLADLERAWATPARDEPVGASLRRLCVRLLYQAARTITIDAPLEAALQREAPQLHTRLFLEPRRENALIGTTPTISPSIVGVSAKVQAQYEANPYPRWISTETPPKAFLTSELIAALNLKPLEHEFAPQPAILIAGCGTGQHALLTARRFLGAQVTALDLSYRSLAYAQRKTEELQVPNIHYLQGDLRDVEQLKRRFDVIESVGVLHHMEDPEVGLAALTRALADHGLLKLGLYSAMARRQIRDFRNSLDNSAVASDDQIRRLRRGMLDKKGGDETYATITASPDFYTLSDCRDLLFHVQEHNYTLPEIQSLLERHGLEFIGFEGLPPAVWTEFASQHGAGHLYSLPHWAHHEQTHPDTFAGMYQFWAVKTTSR